MRVASLYAVWTLDLDHESGRLTVTKSKIALRTDDGDEAEDVFSCWVARGTGIATRAQRPQGLVRCRRAEKARYCETAPMPPTAARVFPSATPSQPMNRVRRPSRM